MSRRYGVFALALCGFALCLMGGFGAVGNTRGVLASAVCVAAWLACGWLVRAAKAPEAKAAVPSVCLFASVGVAVAGLLLGAPPLAMIAAGALSLAVWDLFGLDAFLAGQAPDARSRRHETRHLASLSGALAGGLALCGAAREVSFHLPFAVLFLLVAGIVVALDRLWALLDERRSRVR